MEIGVDKMDEDERRERKKNGDKRSEERSVEWR